MYASTRVSLIYLCHIDIILTMYAPTRVSLIYLADLYVTFLKPFDQMSWKGHYRKLRGSCGKK